MITTLLATFAIAFAGNEMGNGTDYFTDQSAWFVGKDRTIQACLQVDRLFGESEPIVKSAFEAAFATWVGYINLHQVDRLTIGDEDLSYTRKVRWTADCENADLTIYAGVTTSEIAKQKAKYQNPLAFAHQTLKTPSLGWTKGYIWLAREGTVLPQFPNWRQENVLVGVLIHELGHVFGVGHVPGTIMDETLARMLNKERIEGPALAQIDGRRTLQFNGDITYSGVLGIGVGPDEDVRVFEWLFGRKPKGKIQARTANKIQSAPYLEVKDDSGILKLDIACSPSSQNPQFEMEGRIFYRQNGEENGSSASSYTSNTGGVIFCRMKLRDGKSVPVILEHNVSNDDNLGPVTLKRLDTGFPRTLFRAKVEGIQSKPITEKD